MTESEPCILMTERPGKFLTSVVPTGPFVSPIFTQDEGTPRVLILLMPFAPFQPPKPAPGGPATADRLNRTDCKRGGDGTTTSVLRRRVTRSNFSAKWCGVACFAQLHSVKRTREPIQTVGVSVHLRGRGTQKEKGRVCKALFGGSIPSRASTSL